MSKNLRGVSAHGSLTGSRREGGFTVSRLLCIGLASIAAFGLTGPPAGAAGQGQLAGTLGEMWETLLETPGGGDSCYDLGGMVAPFTVFGLSEFTCTVKTGTRLFVVAASAECSNVEPPPFDGGETEATQLACARANDAPFAGTTVTLDGNAVALSEVETSQFNLDLPESSGRTESTSTRPRSS
jgi:hypothetical protein